MQGVAYSDPAPPSNSNAPNPQGSWSSGEQRPASDPGNYAASPVPDAEQWEDAAMYMDSQYVSNLQPQVPTAAPVVSRPPTPQTTPVANRPQTPVVGVRANSPQPTRSSPQVQPAQLSAVRGWANVAVPQGPKPQGNARDFSQVTSDRAVNLPGRHGAQRGRGQPTWVPHAAVGRYGTSPGQGYQPQGPSALTAPRPLGPVVPDVNSFQAFPFADAQQSLLPQQKATSTPAPQFSAHSRHSRGRQLRLLLRRSTFRRRPVDHSLPLMCATSYRWWWTECRS